MWVCSCNGVTDKEIREAAAAGISWRQFCHDSKLGTDCGGCVKLALPMFRKAEEDAEDVPFASKENRGSDSESDFELNTSSKSQSKFTRALIAMARRFR